MELISDPAPCSYAWEKEDGPNIIALATHIGRMWLELLVTAFDLV